MSTCYDNGGITTGAVASGTAGCTLAVTGDGPMQYIALTLLALTFIFVGILLIQMSRRGTRLPLLRSYFPATANSAPLSPVSTAQHMYQRGRHRN